MAPGKLTLCAFIIGGSFSLHAWTCSTETEIFCQVHDRRITLVNLFLHRFSAKLTWTRELLFSWIVSKPNFEFFSVNRSISFLQQSKVVSYHLRIDAKAQWIHFSQSNSFCPRQDMSFSFQGGTVWELLTPEVDPISAELVVWYPSTTS